MENHPIPQDVTGFQFKLIGNLTVKQFAYLAIGVVLALILWQMPVNILIRVPICAFFVILGLGLAYLPISGRPMDLMIGNYIKALFRPTQFVYDKIGGQIYFPNKTPAAIKDARQYQNSFSPLPKDKLKIYLDSLNSKPKNNFPMSAPNIMANSVLHQPVSAPNLSVQPTAPHFNPAPQVPAPAPPASPNLNKLINPTALTEQPKTAGQILRAPDRAIGMPSVPDSPNLVTGITKDARGNALSNILIEVKDKEGNPVRAFKTNEVGRFASATPLINGVYTMEFEDPKAQNKFKEITINATGQIIMPIEAISVDVREELRRSLFANTNAQNINN